MSRSDRRVADTPEMSLPPGVDATASTPGARSRLWILVAVALCARLAWVLLCPNQPVSDQGVYHNAALEIARGAGFLDERGEPLGWWPVGYPALLGVAYAVFGGNVVVGHLLNVVLGVLSVIALRALGTKWFSARVGTAAGFVAALHPTLVLYTTVLATEHAFMLGSLIVLLALSRVFTPTRCVFWAIVAGLLIGGVTYVRPTGLAFLPLALVFAWPERRERARTLLRLLLVGGVAVATLVPWGLRNQRAFGVFSLTSLNAGSNLWMGNHEGSDGCYVELPDRVAALPLVEREAVLRAEAVAFIRADPIGYAKRCVVRTVATLKSDTIAVVWNERGLDARLGAWAKTPLKAICTGVHVLLWTAALLGLAWSFVRRRYGLGVVALAATLAVLAAPFVLIVGGNRYHLPAIPFVILAAIAAVRRDHSIS